MLRTWKFAVALVCLLPLGAQADEDHGIGKIVNDQMDLTYIDHVLTGRIGDRPVFGKPLADAFGLSLWHKAEGQEFATELVREGDQFVGGIESLNPQEEVVSADFIVTEVNGGEGRFRGSLAGRDFEVIISADEMEGHHYVDPTFDVLFADGGAYQFQLEGSQACMGCALKLSYAVLSMLHAYGAL